MPKCDNGCNKPAGLHTRDGNHFCSPACCIEYHRPTALTPKRMLYTQDSKKEAQV